MCCAPTPRRGQTVSLAYLAGAQAAVTTTDVCDRAAVEAMVSTAIDSYGGIDSFNSAGAAFRATFLRRSTTI